MGGLLQPDATKKWLAAPLEMEFPELECFGGVCAGAEQPQTSSACAGKGVGQEGSEAEVLLSTGMSLACR